MQKLTRWASFGRFRGAGGQEARAGSRRADDDSDKARHTMRTKLLLGFLSTSMLAFAGCGGKDDSATGTTVTAGDDSNDEDNDDDSGSADDNDDDSGSADDNDDD